MASPPWSTGNYRSLRRAGSVCKACRSARRRFRPTRSSSLRASAARSSLWPPTGGGLGRIPPAGRSWQSAGRRTASGSPTSSTAAGTSSCTSSTGTASTTRRSTARSGRYARRGERIRLRSPTSAAAGRRSSTTSGTRSTTFSGAPLPSRAWPLRRWARCWWSRRPGQSSSARRRSRRVRSKRSAGSTGARRRRSKEG